ncbi:hypothetical protein AMK21_09950 [Streptomyces sp. CB00316]|nr:hypothetical protein AMK21_09950 [Streptomyces sp. CB00316]
MRADRLVSLVLPRRRGRLSAAALARELEVSPRTGLRDIEAMSRSPVCRSTPNVAGTAVSRCCPDSVDALATAVASRHSASP